MTIPDDVAQAILRATEEYQGWITRAAAGLADAAGRTEVTLEDVRRACLLHIPAGDLDRPSHSRERR